MYLRKIKHCTASFIEKECTALAKIRKQVCPNGIILASFSNIIFKFSQVYWGHMVGHLNHMMGNPRQIVVPTISQRVLTQRLKITLYRQLSMVPSFAFKLFYYREKQKVQAENKFTVGLIGRPEMIIPKNINSRNQFTCSFLSFVI